MSLQSIWAMKETAARAVSCARRGQLESIIEWMTFTGSTSGVSTAVSKIEPPLARQYESVCHLAKRIALCAKFGCEALRFSNTECLLH